MHRVVPTLCSVLVGLVLLVLAGCSSKMSEQEAQSIASATRSVCVMQGTVGDMIEYQEKSQTWMFEFSPNNPIKNCDPVCVVDQKTKKVEIYWRCGRVG